MFDIGFQELLLVAVVALVVVGPERLPHLARVAGKWIGRARRTLISVQQEIERELKAEELKRVLEEQARRQPLETLLDEPALGQGASAAVPKASMPPQAQGSQETKDPSGYGRDAKAPSGPAEQTPRP